MIRCKKHFNDKLFSKLPLFMLKDCVATVFLKKKLYFNVMFLAHSSKDSKDVNEVFCAT